MRCWGRSCWRRSVCGHGEVDDYVIELTNCCGWAMGYGVATSGGDNGLDRDVEVSARIQNFAYPLFAQVGIASTLLRRLQRLGVPNVAQHRR